MLARLRLQAAELGVGMRRRAVGLLIDNLLHGMSAAARLHPRSRPAHHHVEVLPDVPYTSGLERHHLLDIYRPTRGAGPWPVMLYVHGGGFRILSKDTHWVMGLGYARRGMIVFNINYRLAPAHPFPAALEDVCDAYRWVLANAERFGGDLSRLVVAGESAGANLVTALTLASCYRRPQPLARAFWELDRVPSAVLPACGIYQVSDVERFRNEPRLPSWVVDRIEVISDAYIRGGGRSSRAGAAETDHGDGALELADPLVILERGERPERPLPPFFAIVGTRDPLMSDTRRLAAALHALGVPCEARYYPGEIHAFNALVWREQARQAWRDSYAFLDGVLDAGT